MKDKLKVEQHILNNMMVSLKKKQKETLKQFDKVEKLKEIKNEYKK